MENKPDPNIRREVPANEKKNTTNRVLILIIAFLTITTGVLLWQFLELRKGLATQVADTQEVTEEKDALTQELENMLMQYDMLQTDNTTLQEEIESQKNRIEELLKDVQKYKGQAAMMAKYQKETVTLRQIMQNYVHQIDSLNQALEAKTIELGGVRTELLSEKQRAELIERERAALGDRVKSASVLDALQISATGIFLKSGGKESETNRIKRTERIRTCFTLSENRIATPGDKVVYIRIKTPAGKILAESADETSMAEFDGMRGVYSAKKVVDYQNKLQTVCAYYILKEGETLPEGRYHIDIFADGTLIGQTTTDLK